MKVFPGIFGSYYWHRLIGSCTKILAKGTRFGDQNAFIVVIPRYTCETCRSAAIEAALQEKQSGRWQYVLVQNIAEGSIENV